MARYSKFHSNYILKKKHQNTYKGAIFERDWVTIGGQHQIEKGKRPYYNDSNFLFTDNSYPSYKKKFNFGKWVAHWVYEDVKDAKEDVNIVKVNDSSNDIRDFAYYGSAVELVRSSVTDIINEFPATVTISSEDMYEPDGNGGYKIVSGYHMVNNPFNMDFVHTLSEEEKEKYNVNRFLAESYTNYTINGKEITGYSLVNRKFVKRDETKPYTQKAFIDSITFDRVEDDINYLINSNSLRSCKYYNGHKVFENVELVPTGSANIPDINYTFNDLSKKISVLSYDRYDGKLTISNGDSVGKIGGPIVSDELEHEVKVTITTGEGYGYNDNFVYNGTNVEINNLQNCRQNLGTIILKGGSNYRILEAGEESEYLFLDGLTGDVLLNVTYYSNENDSPRRKLIITSQSLQEDVILSVDNAFTSVLFDEYKHDGVLTFISNNNQETTISNEINVNISKDLDVYSFENGNYEFIVSNNNEAKYVGGETNKTKKDFNGIVSKHMYYHESSRTITFEDWQDNNPINLSINTGNIIDNSFVFSLLKKSQSSTSIEESFIIHPCIPFTILNDSYFFIINGDRTNDWKYCFKDEDRPSAITDAAKIGISGDNLVCFGQNQTNLGSVSGKDSPYTVEFYVNRSTPVKYCFVQCTEDIPEGCTLLDSIPYNWLPSTTFNCVWDEYVKVCPDCIDSDCSVQKLWSDQIQKPNTEYKNYPLYTLTLSTIEGEETVDYIFESYIQNGQEVLITTADVDVAIKPKKELLDAYFSELEGFEKQLLNLNSKPFYSNSFLTPIEGELTYKYVYRDYTWPSVYDSDLGYAIIDIMSETYMDYLTKLIDLATVFDELWCDNIYKNMTHESIKNFDWTYTKDYNDGDEQDNVDGGNQVMQLLRVYGRFFDDVKRKIDGIGFVKNNTYEGFDNQPDAEISDRLELKGWDITSTIPNFKDTEQGYINKFTGVIITKEEYDNLPADTNTNNSEQDTTGETGGQSDYEIVFYNEEKLEFIGETAYNNLEDEEKNLYVKYYPYLNLGDITIDDEFLSTYVNGVSTNVSDSTNDPNEGKWYPSANSSRLTCSKVDIEFMRKLMLSSSRIFNTKGTRQAIEMVLAMFGIGENDYTLTEGYYSTVAKPYDSKLSEDDNEDDTKLIDAIENINYFKDYPKNYDDIYSGVPLKDIFLDSNHVIVPYYEHKRIYDGDFIFESRGGWGKKTDTLVNGEGNESGQYTETMSYLHVVSDFSDLLDLNPNSLSDGDIYYVANISTYSEYVAELPENMSHFFHLKEEIVVEGTDEVTQENGKYNPQLPESWENVDMTNDDEVSKKAKYLDSIISVNVGNNPHVGFGTYDDGNEFKEYMETPFKYSIDHYLLPDTYKEQAEKINFKLTDEKTGGYINKITGEIIDENSYNALTNNEKINYTFNDKIKVLIDYSDEDGINEVNEGSEQQQTEDEIPYYLNRKYFKITNKVENELFKQYFNDVILKYIMQVVPSTTLLVLDKYMVYGKIVERDDFIDVRLLYTGDINWNATNSIYPILSCRQGVVYENGARGSIAVIPDTVYYTTSDLVNATCDLNTGVVTGDGTEADSEGRKIIGMITAKVTYEDYIGLSTIRVYQRGRKVIGYSDMKINFSYDITVEGEGKEKLEWNKGKAEPVIECEQTTYYDDGSSDITKWTNKTPPEGYKALSDDFNISFTGTYNRLDSDETGIMEVDEAHKDDEYNNSYSDRSFEIVTVTLTRKEEDSSNTDNNP